MKAVHKMGVVNEPSSRGYNPRPAREAYVFKTVDTAAKALACNLYVCRERMHSPLGSVTTDFFKSECGIHGSMVPRVGSHTAVTLSLRDHNRPLQTHRPVSPHFPCGRGRLSIAEGQLVLIDWTICISQMSGLTLLQQVLRRKRIQLCLRAQ